MYEIDINCDVGEGIKTESDLFPFISSCNIACGGHTGDKNSMYNTILLAKKYKVKIGAHPSYPDKTNFGRRSMSIPFKDLENNILEQITDLKRVLDNNGLNLHHIKPHGALYNDIAIDSEKADLYLKIMEIYKKELILFLPLNSVVIHLAKKRGFICWSEGFGDRTYLPNLTLVPRNQPMSIINEPKKVARQISQIVKEKKITTSEGDIKDILADTICVHGDTPNALQILMYLSKELPKQNILLKK